MEKLLTKTGNFPIGFRRGGWPWQSDIHSAIAWAQSNGFAAIDLASDPADIAPVQQSGLRIGSIDLLDWPGLMSPDKSKRADSVAKNSDYIKTCGGHNYFAVMLPEKHELPRYENFGYMTESLNLLAPVLESVGGRLVIEGWPGPGALCCTPETYRATFRECPSKAIGINYDPSHLLRMGIDPIRFLKEFTVRVGHVHGKDTEILADDLYEYGREQAATFKQPPAFGSYFWRYTVPGYGDSNWSEIFRILTANGYAGAVSIELEDKNFNGTPAGEQLGLLTGAKYLAIC